MSDARRLEFIPARIRARSGRNVSAVTSSSQVAQDRIIQIRIP